MRPTVIFIILPSTYLSLTHTHPVFQLYFVVEDKVGTCNRQACNCDRIAATCFKNNRYSPVNKVVEVHLSEKEVSYFFFVKIDLVPDSASNYDKDIKK